MLIQEYDFLIEHIPGVDNVVADTFSRLWFEPVNQDNTSEQAKHDEYVNFLEELELVDKVVDTTLVQTLLP